MADLSPYILGCVGCRLCKGAAYQLPPFLYAGNPKAHILVIAQNPGEIGGDEKDKWRKELLPLVTQAEGDTNALVLKTIYDVDFATSHGYHEMEKIFGTNWLSTGKFLYTNAVRCRTEKNEAPSDEMESNCMAWTSQLPIPKVVVLMGKVAMRQFCEMVHKPELDTWKMVKLTRGTKLSHVVTIPHYAAIRSHADLERACNLYQDALMEADIYES